MRRRMVGAIALAVVVTVGFGACNTPSGLDVERRVAAEAYRVERGDISAKPSEARCEVTNIGPHDQQGGQVAHTTCSVRGYSYDLLAVYGGPPGARDSVTIRAYLGGGAEPNVVSCDFRYTSERWQLGTCKQGGAEPRP